MYGLGVAIIYLVGRISAFALDPRCLPTIFDYIIHSYNTNIYKPTVYTIHFTLDIFCDVSFLAGRYGKIVAKKKKRKRPST